MVISDHRKLKEEDVATSENEKVEGNILFP